jgi:hypothetical protein
MLRSLINECRAELFEDAAIAATPRKNKHDRAAGKVGYVLSTPPENISRKKMLKAVSHMYHHFEKGHGKGDGDYRTVDLDDLTTLGRHAEAISNHANSVTRMPGPAHHFAAHLCGHVANAHERMGRYWNDNGNEESTELHGNECAKHGALSKHHHKVAKRHGYHAYNEGDY